MVGYISRQGLKRVMNVDTVIIGAGPYGLSIAAHLSRSS
jgi:cation diffusion facilitator CzcD-associated flavoprotein CzcO